MMEKALTLGWSSQRYWPPLHLLPQISRMPILADPMRLPPLQTSCLGSFGSVAPSPGVAVVVSVGWLPWVSPFCPWGHRAMVREQPPLSLERCCRNHPKGEATALQGGTGGSLGWYLLPDSSVQHVLDICHGLGMVRD